MKFDEIFYESLIENMDAGFACHKIITDANNKPIDYEFIDVNKLFENLTGLKKENIIGKRVTEVISGIENDKFEWINVYGEVSLKGGKLSFEQYSEVLGKWYSVSVYSPSRGYFVTIFNDITRIKEEEDQKYFLKIAIDLLCITGFDGYFKYLNPLWFKKLGWTEKEFKEIPFMDFVHPDDMEATKTSMQKLIKGQKVIDFDNRYKCKNGSYIWLSWRFYTMKNKGLIYAVARDITERKIAEEFTKDKENKLNVITDNMSDVISQVDEKGNFIYLSPSVKRVLGYEPDLFMKKTYDDLVHPDDIDFILTTIHNAVLAKIALVRMEYRCKHIKGHYVWLEAQSHILYDKEGRFNGAVSASRDINNRKESEERIKQNEVKLKNILATAPIGITVIDINGKVTFWNEACEKIFGWEQKDVIGKLNPILPSDDINELYEDKKQLQNFSLELKAIRKNGNIIDVRFSRESVKDHDGKVTGFIELFEDITERKGAVRE